MNSRHRLNYAAAALLPTIVWMIGCQTETPQSKPFAPDAREVVVTTFYPTTWMTERLLADLVPAECPLPTGEDPIFWQPSTEAIGSYQSAKLIVTNGAGFEKWIGTVTLPGSRIVDTTAGLSDPFIQYENAVVHQHGPSGQHSHEGTDGHTWLDPIIAKHQAGRIAEAAGRAWPQHIEAINANLKSLHEQLDSIDARLSEMTPKLKDVRILCSHPAYNYVARRYGWAIQNFDLDPEQKIPTEQLAAFSKDQSERTTVMLWESEPTTAPTSQLAEAGVVSVVFSPGEGRPAQGDYFSLMIANLDRLEAALQ